MKPQPTTTMQPRNIPFLALGGVWEQDDVAAAMNIITAAAQPNGNFFPIPEETNFQKALAAHEECAHAVVVNSCGTALDLCMIALGIKTGDEVIVPGLTFVCTGGTAAARGAKVVFADVDAATLCLSPAAVEAKMTPRTKAIIPVHFSGLAADIEGFSALSLKTGVPILVLMPRRVSDDFKFEFILSDPIIHKPTEDKEKDIREITQKFTSEIEKTVRRYPEQWLWAHRRWLDINR